MLFEADPTRKRKQSDGQAHQGPGGDQQDASLTTWKQELHRESQLMAILTVSLHAAVLGRQWPSAHDMLAVIDHMPLAQCQPTAQSTG